MGKNSSYFVAAWQCRGEGYTSSTWYSFLDSKVKAYILFRMLYFDNKYQCAI